MCVCVCVHTYYIHTCRYCGASAVETACRYTHTHIHTHTHTHYTYTIYYTHVLHNTRIYVYPCYTYYITQYIHICNIHVYIYVMYIHTCELYNTHACIYTRVHRHCGTAAVATARLLWLAGQEEGGCHALGGGGCTAYVGEREATADSCELHEVITAIF